MTVLGDVLQLTMKGNYLQQSMENVYFYRVEDTPTDGALEGLATEFQTTVLDAITGIQSTAVTWTDLKVVNIFDKSEIHEEALETYGTIACGGAATETPSFIAVHTTFVRDNARVDNGGKYFGGICEGNVSQNTVVGLTSELAAMDDALAETLTAGGVDSFRPVIVKRTRVTAQRINKFDETVSYYKYGMPASISEMGNLWAYVREARSSIDVSHMDSRQKGRGA